MRLLLILLCSVSLANAQVPFFERDSAAVKLVPGLPAKEPFDTAHVYKKAERPFIYIISDNDLYNVFGYSTYRQLSDFDFSKYHILGLQECKQCLRVCRHEMGRKECHRNVCSREWVWLQRENEKAFTEIPSTTLKGHADAQLHTGRDSFFTDTVIHKPTNGPMAYWYTTAGGDCHASFKFAVFTDSYYPALLLKEWNYYGGCRAGGSWNFTICFTELKGSRYYVKSILLMERDRY